MATHSSILAWRTPGTEEPGGLQSLGSQRVAHASVCAEWLSTHTLLTQVVSKIVLLSEEQFDERHHEPMTLTPWKKSYDQPRQHIKKQRHYFANKGPSSQGYGFSSSHV